MEVPHSPGFLWKIALYLWDVFKMPSRIAKLAAGATDQASRKLPCPNCGEETYVTQTIVLHGNDQWYYRCRKCDGRFSKTYKPM